MITGAQMRMARGYLRWSVKEDVDHMPNALSDNLARIRSTLEAAGVEFIPENGGGPGVRLKKRSADTGPKPFGPATDAVDAMDEAIEGDKMKQRERRKADG